MNLLNILISLESKSTQKKRYLLRNSHLGRRINVEETFFQLIVFSGDPIAVYILRALSRISRVTLARRSCGFSSAFSVVCDGELCKIAGRLLMEAWRYSALNTQFCNLQQKLLSTMQSSK